MLERDFLKIGARMYRARKARGLTQAEVAEAAEISDRTYADIERGSVNMRLETMLSICTALKITPDELLTTVPPDETDTEEILSLLNTCGAAEKQTALKLLKVYLQSLH
ncbi:MAG: helix-turn-helix transcriptional regulator [Clostridia bacterium]|nr:helix-turn-helix transcriptional regulator [Clostridia bacterium]